MTKEKISNDSLLGLLRKAGGESDWISAPALEHMGREWGVDLTRGALRRRLSAMRHDVRYQTDDSGVRRFRLRNASQRFETTRHSAKFVRPGTPWSSQHELRDFLGQTAEGDLLVVDPFLSPRTLDVLRDVVVPIKLVTTHCGERGREDEFRRDFNLFRKEHGKIELRVVAADFLHGRYIFSGEHGWVVDHSLKDLGTKPALIVPLHMESVHRKVRAYFEDIFNQGIAYT